MNYRRGGYRGDRYRRRNVRDYYYLPYYLDYLEYDDLYGYGYEYPYMLQIEGMSGQSSGTTIASTIVSIIVLVLIIGGIFYAVKWYRTPKSPGQEAIGKFKEGIALAQVAVKQKVDEIVKAGQQSAQNVSDAVKK